MQVDLAPFVESTRNTEEKLMYHLHGVLVHSGDVNGGHYFAFIRPEKDGRWYRFDDDKVTPVLEDDVL